MLPENATNKIPDRPYTQTIPLSQRDSGVNLDECCEGGMEMEAGMKMIKTAGGSMQQAEGGMGMDFAIRKIDGRNK